MYFDVLCMIPLHSQLYPHSKAYSQLLYVYICRCKYYAQLSNQFSKVLVSQSIQLNLSVNVGSYLSLEWPSKQIIIITLHYYQDIYVYSGLDHHHQVTTILNTFKFVYMQLVSQLVQWAIKTQNVRFCFFSLLHKAHFPYGCH